MHRCINLCSPEYAVSLKWLTNSKWNMYNAHFSALSTYIRLYMLCDSTMSIICILIQYFCTLVWPKIVVGCTLGAERGVSIPKNGWIRPQILWSGHLLGTQEALVCCALVDVVQTNGHKQGEQWLATCATMDFILAIQYGSIMVSHTVADLLWWGNT